MKGSYMQVFSCLVCGFFFLSHLQPVVTYSHKQGMMKQVCFFPWRTRNRGLKSLRYGGWRKTSKHFFSQKSSWRPYWELIYLQDIFSSLSDSKFHVLKYKKLHRDRGNGAWAIDAQWWGEFILNTKVVVFCDHRAGNFWNAVFGFTSSNWFLGFRKAEIQNPGREPEVLCIRPSAISGDSVSLREIHWGV